MQTGTKYHGYARTFSVKESAVPQLNLLKEFGVPAKNITCVEIKRRSPQKTIRHLYTLRRGEALVITSLDRLDIPVQEVITLWHNYHKEGVDFISIHDGIDSRATSGIPLYVLAEKLVKLNQPPIAPGSKPPGRRKSLNTEQQKYVLALHERLTPIHKIAQKLGVSQRTIYRYINKQQCLPDS